MNTKTRLKIETLTGVTGGSHLEKSLEAIPGVQAVQLDHHAGLAIVEHDGADPQRLVATARAEGFNASLA